LVFAVRQPCNEPKPIATPAEAVKLKAVLPRASRKAHENRELRVTPEADGRVVIVRPPTDPSRPWAASGWLPRAALLLHHLNTLSDTPPRHHAPLGRIHARLESSAHHRGRSCESDGKSGTERNTVDTATPATQRTRNLGTTRHAPSSDVHIALSWHALRWTVDGHQASKSD
jgi:hypothetical protein